MRPATARSTSRNARRRALVLIAVHLIVAAHVTHFVLTRRSVSPVEPSESMYTLELGHVNAGVIFFATALVATLVFGRFFCGWGCHLVALQDLCAHVLRKVGLRPRPFRSRVLKWGPLVAALYMFAWPTFKRWALTRPPVPFPGFTNHLLTNDLWRTFPGPAFTVLTLLTCGFVAVYVLGSKGFCTYGCPYGAMFGALDRLSPGRIVVDSSCEQCGLCTATCTSNVLVHHEIRTHGRVVDPGCMKCMDCVAVCPNEALSYSFARPAILDRLASWTSHLRSGRPSPTRSASLALAGDPRPYDLTLAEDLVVGGVAVGTVLAWRGLYDGPPLLMSIALGAITAFAVAKLIHLARRETVKLPGLPLKLAGEVQRPGTAMVACTIAWLLLTAHGGFVQWERVRGRAALGLVAVSHGDLVTGAFRAALTEAQRDAAASAELHFLRAERFGFVGVVENRVGLATTALLRDDVDAAVRHLRDAIALAPSDAVLRENLVDLLVARGRTADAMTALEAQLGAVPGRASDHFRLGTMMLEAGRTQDALVHLTQASKMSPDLAPARYNLGGLLRRLGRPADAVVELRAAAALDPKDADTQVELGLALADAGLPSEAVQALRRAVSLAPDRPESKAYLPSVIEKLEATTRGVGRTPP